MTRAARDRPRIFRRSGGPRGHEARRRSPATTSKAKGLQHLRRFSNATGAHRRARRARTRGQTACTPVRANGRIGGRPLPSREAD